MGGDWAKGPLITFLEELGSALEWSGNRELLRIGVSPKEPFLRKSLMRNIYAFDPKKAA